MLPQKDPETESERGKSGYKIFDRFNREEKKKKATSSTKEVHKKIILLIHLFN